MATIRRKGKKWNDALLCLDEIEQMQPSEIGEVAYMLANGVGKVRSDLGRRSFTLVPLPL